MPSAARICGVIGIDLARAREDAAARRDQRGVVVGPGASAAARTAGARSANEVAASGSGSMKMCRWSKAATSRMCSRQQHAVAEHVAGHVADADDGEVLGLGVDAQLAEVALDRLPGAAGGDAHRLVVVADRAAGGEGVAEPEAVRLGDVVGDVGEGRGALVGGDDQVGVVAVVPDDVASAARPRRRPGCR